MPEPISSYYTYDSNSGLIVENTQDLINEVAEEFKTAYGVNLVTTPDTPQGVQIAAEVTARRNVILNNVALANQINPDAATGVFLDAICSLIGINRIQATPTKLTNCELEGIKGTTVPINTIVETVIHDQFRLTGSVTLDDNGKGSGQFEALITGPVICDKGAKLTVIEPVLGLTTVTNINEAILGVNQQTDESLRDLRKDALSLKSIGTTHAHISNLILIDGVKSLKFRDNSTKDPMPVDPKIESPTIDPYSIWVCIDNVVDGNKEKVAISLLNLKTAGAGWSGNQTLKYIDPYSNQTYEVKYYKPDPIKCFIKITTRIKQEDVVKQVLNYVDKFYKVGVDISPFDIAIYLQENKIPITKVEISNNKSTYTSAVFPVQIFQIAVTTVDDIVVVNQ